MIAWGGPLAQLIFASPFSAYVVLVGFTRFQAVTAILAIFGFFNVVIALFNLVPFEALDGGKAWTLFRHRRERPKWTQPREKTPLDALNEALKKAQNKPPARS